MPASVQIEITAIEHPAYFLTNIVILYCITYFDYHDDGHFRKFRLNGGHLGNLIQILEKINF